MKECSSHANFEFYVNFFNEWIFLLIKSKIFLQRVSEKLSEVPGTDILFYEKLVATLFRFWSPPTEKNVYDGLRQYL